MLLNIQQRALHLLSRLIPPLERPSNSVQVRSTRANRRRLVVVANVQTRHSEAYFTWQNKSPVPRSREFRFLFLLH